MPYIPKTNWQYNDVLKEQDMNRIEDGIQTGIQSVTAHTTDKNNPHSLTAAQIGAAKTTDLAAYVKADGTTPFTGNPTLRKGVGTLIFDASRTNTAMLRWNASSTLDLGLQIHVDGVVAAVFKSDSSLTVGKLITTDERLQRYSRRVDPSSVDAKGYYKICDWLREDGTLYLRTTASNPDANGYYRTDVWDYYNATGQTLVKKETYTYTWDARGIRLSSSLASEMTY